MNRITLQQLSEARIDDVHALLSVHRWPGAYYLAGYALECALKSCVLAHVERTGVIFKDKKYAQNCWTHDIEELVRLSGLRLERDRATGLNVTLGQHWLIAKDWSESSRYELCSQPQAERLCLALADPQNGVLAWVKNYW